MTTITIISIIVIAILMGAIFGLTWLSYLSCLKSYKIELDSGRYDEEINNAFNIKKDSKQVIVKIFSKIITCLLLFVLLGLFITGIIYRIKGENFSIGNKTLLVIKSNSMSNFYNNQLNDVYKELGYDNSLQFTIGDICIFEKADLDNLILGEVYGYRYKNIIITHRLIDNINDSYYIFKGDNNPTKDQILVTPDRIMYHYTGRKLRGLGYFILYAQSYLGISSLISIIGIIISSDIVLHKIHKLNKERAYKLKQH